MESALNLEGLLVGDSTFRTSNQRAAEAAKRFVRLIASTPCPKEDKERGTNNIFTKLIRLITLGAGEPPMFTREQIQEILVRSNLVREGTELSIAVDEVLKKKYTFEDDRGFSQYWFTELIDGNGNKLYDFRYGRTNIGGLYEWLMWDD